MHSPLLAMPTPSRLCARFPWLWAVLWVGLGTSPPAAFGAEGDQSYYLPAGQDYAPEIATPRSSLGAEVGEWHVEHEALTRYFETLAQSSPRVTLEEIGRTHENRPLVFATISSPRNLARIEEIRSRHLRRLTATDPDEASEEGPVIVWMGYGVHGDEPSGSHAALLLAYHLAAARGPAIDQLLENSVILLDPCLNPDGFNRFSTWANMHRGVQLVGDPAHREHRAVWPGGRTNHYWFDLNRDWLLLTHPESEARLAQFHRWKPNLLTDFHEMGTNQSYFFQPGIPSQQNPLTPSANLDLTRRIARYHAQALDAIGSAYYTEESFDDFYYGKGSTYPDINGGIGILFEQASSRGHVQDSPNGPLTFPFTIRNQFVTSLSSLQAALEMRRELLAYQREFYHSAIREGERQAVSGYVFGEPLDPARTSRFVDILLQHQIQVHELVAPITVDGVAHRPGSSFVVSLAQPQSRLALALFETRRTFADPSFYDVSTWNLPLSFGLPYAALSRDTLRPAVLGESLRTPPRPLGSIQRTANTVAYAFSWNSYHAPRAVQRLLAAGIRVRAATRTFGADTVTGVQEFGRGAIVVALGTQDSTEEEVRSALTDIALQDGIEIYAVTTGLTPDGIDLGSPSLIPLTAPKPLLVVGPGVSATEAGEVWHLLDHRYSVPVSLVESADLNSLPLDRYTHVVLVSGSYDAIETRGRDALRAWVRAGGTLLAVRGSVTWVEREILERKKEEPEKKPEPPATAQSYGDYARLRAQARISGAIFAATVDPTHPLAFGIPGDRLATFRDHTNVVEVDSDPFATPVRYSQSPLLSGYASNASVKKLRGTAVVAANRLGRGVVVRYADNPNFRGVWYGTNRLFANGVFFSPLIQPTGEIR